MNSIFLVLEVFPAHMECIFSLEVVNTFGYFCVYTFNLNILKSLSYADDKSWYNYIVQIPDGTYLSLLDFLFLECDLQHDYNLSPKNDSSSSQIANKKGLHNVHLPTKHHNT